MTKKLKLEKKAQFKIQQTAFMLLFVVLFFILVALFWMMLQSRGLREKANLLAEEQAMLMSEFISGASEFSCSREMGAYCVDADKLIVLSNRSVYKEFFPVSYIKIRKIYPWNLTRDIECTKANYPDCNLFSVYSNEKIEGKNAIASFVALCRHEKTENNAGKICELGKLNIGYSVR